MVYVEFETVGSFSIQFVVEGLKMLIVKVVHCFYKTSINSSKFLVMFWVLFHPCCQFIEILLDVLHNISLNSFIDGSSCNELIQRDVLVCFWVLNVIDPVVVVMWAVIQRHWTSNLSYCLQLNCLVGVGINMVITLMIAECIHVSIALIIVEGVINVSFLVIGEHGDGSLHH